MIDCYYFNKDNLSNICLDCKPINASTMIKVPLTLLYCSPNFNVNINTIAYTITVLIYTFQTFGSLKNFDKNITTTKNEITNITYLLTLFEIIKRPKIDLSDTQNK